MKTTLRVKRDRVKEDIVVTREYLNIVLENEDVAEFDYKATKCKQSYRVIVIRKYLSEERGGRVLIDKSRGFLLHHQRSDFDGRRIGVLAQRSLQSGERYRADHGWSACVSRSCG